MEELSITFPHSNLLLNVDILCPLDHFRCRNTHLTGDQQTNPGLPLQQSVRSACRKVKFHIRPTQQPVLIGTSNTGHYTFECKYERPYVSRPSRTQQLQNPRLLAKLKADGKPSVEVPEEFKNKYVTGPGQLAALLMVCYTDRSGIANKILEAKEKERSKELKEKEVASSSRKRARCETTRPQPRLLTHCRCTGLRHHPPLPPTRTRIPLQNRIRNLIQSRLRLPQVPSLIQALHTPDLQGPVLVRVLGIANGDVVAALPVTPTIPGGDDPFYQHVYTHLALVTASLYYDLNAFSYILLDKKVGKKWIVLTEKVWDNKIQQSTCQSYGLRIHDQCNNKSTPTVSPKKSRINGKLHDVPIETQNLGKDEDENHGDKDFRFVQESTDALAK